MSRAPHEPTPASRKQVETLSAYGVKVEDIARSVGITPNTLRKHYSDELHNGAMQANAAVAQNMYRIATNEKGNVRAQVDAGKFWLARRAGWKEEVTHRHGGTEDRPPINVAISDGFEHFVELLESAVRIRTSGGDEEDGMGESGAG